MREPKAGEDYAALHLGATLEPCEISPIHIDISTGVVIVPILFRKPCCWGFMVVTHFSHWESDSSVADFLVLQLLDPSTPSSDIPRAGYKACIMKMLIGARYTMVNCSQYCDWWYFFWSLFSKLLWWRGRVVLTINRC